MNDHNPLSKTERKSPVSLPPGMKLMHDQCLILLDEVRESSNSSSIIIPLYMAYETEGGRPATKISDVNYLSKGTLMYPYLDLKVGTKVYVSPSAVSPHYQFFLDRDSLVLEFEGMILIPPTLIQAYFEHVRLPA